ncbi:putative bifunctional diguanylate cyclase/phosphodiesterase [Rhizobium mesoamericanum]|uniref:putative bifunctional diguanylate cyclase/phosphodiesterase n=1 Tax=Rhizobium mesoamericanum TaxID=1079800 RepID=UPI001FCC5FF4|nr:EAL domain-containing protein [Rhizobium mesoamericanum]
MLLADIMDTASTPEFDSIVELTSCIFEAPIALVSLVDRNRQWFKARIGVDLQEAPRLHSFCAHVTDTMQPLTVSDAAADLRFKDNVFVNGGSAIRSYAGAPLIENGTCYGSLCVMDRKVRSFGHVELNRLEKLATVVIGLVREHRQKSILKEQQRELELRQARFEQTEQSAKVGGFEMDLQTGQIVWSDQVYRTVGLPVGTVMTSEKVLSCYAPEERAGVATRIRNALSGAGTGVDKEYRIITPDGEERWVHIVSDIEHVDGVPRRLFGILQDISDRHRHEQRLIQAANTDGLTGLRNRASFNCYMEARYGEKKPDFALLLADVDSLKQLNDTLGHAAGDVLLKEVAKRLTRALRNRGVIFRLGGDEFAIAVEEASTARSVMAIARRLIRCVTRPLKIDGSTITPKITIGGAFAAHCESVSELSQNADFALYHAKETHRGGYVQFESGLRTRIERRLKTTRELEQAILENRLSPHYQPIVSSANGDVIGFEALVRMSRSDGSIIAAAQFHEALTDATISHRVTTQMLEHAAADMRRWLDDGLSFGRVGINISTADFMRGDLETRIRATFSRHGVPLNHLLLEVTETVFMQGSEEKVAETLQRLRNKGVLVALDDFGTGYASLTHLRSLPVDIIKIDRSFIDTMLADSSSMAIVELVFDLAKKLGLKVTAEGVETFGQVARLLELGCRSLQGYFFGKPLPAFAAEQRLQSQKAANAPQVEREMFLVAGQN